MNKEKERVHSTRCKGFEEGRPEERPYPRVWRSKRLYEPIVSQDGGLNARAPGLTRVKPVLTHGNVTSGVSPNSSRAQSCSRVDPVRGAAGKTTTNRGIGVANIAQVMRGRVV